MKYDPFESLIIEGVKQRKTAREIAEGIAKQRPDWNVRNITPAVYHIAYKNGFLPFPRRANSLRNSEIIKQRREGLTFAAIGKLHGITRQAVWAICERAGL